MDTIKEGVAHRCSDACAKICRCTLVASAKILVVLLSNVFSLLSRLQILLCAGMPFRIGKRWDTVHPCIYNIDTGLWIDSKWCRLEAMHCREVLKQFSATTLLGPLQVDPCRRAICQVPVNALGAKSTGRSSIAAFDPSRCSLQCYAAVTRRDLNTILPGTPVKS